MRAGRPSGAPRPRRSRGRHTGAATLCDLLLGFDMRRPLLVAAVTASLVLAACGGSGSTGGSGSGSPGGGSGSVPAAAATPAATAATSATAAASGDQFGGDVCSALTKTEVQAATYPQGVAKFDSTDTQKDAATGKAVVCQYLVTFGDNPSIVGVFVSLMDDTEYATRTAVSLIAPPEALAGIGPEAFLVQPAPGLFEVWVTGAHGKFKLGAQAKDTAIALATLAAARD
jgi:hypothetical protein